nr:MAG TPA: hypothetical protein [Bacteriophage sp.]
MIFRLIVNPIEPIGNCTLSVLVVTFARGIIVAAFYGWVVQVDFHKTFTGLLTPLNSSCYEGRKEYYTHAKRKV